jgi:hypothetical protein
LAKYTNKTLETGNDVAAYIAAVENDTRRADAEALVEMFCRLTGEPAKMWGPSIIGFGSYHYKYESGHEGESCRTGFSPRKANLVLYLKGGYDTAEGQEVLSRLGKHKPGKGCLYLVKLSDVDLEVLEEMVRDTIAHMDAKYPREITQ